MLLYFFVAVPNFFFDVSKKDFKRNCAPIDLNNVDKIAPTEALNNFLFVDLKI